MAHTFTCPLCPRYLLRIPTWVLRTHSPDMSTARALVRVGALVHVELRERPRSPDTHHQRWPCSPVASLHYDPKACFPLHIPEPCSQVCFSVTCSLESPKENNIPSAILDDSLHTVHPSVGPALAAAGTIPRQLHLRHPLGCQHLAPTYRGSLPTARGFHVSPCSPCCPRMSN